MSKAISGSKVQTNHPADKVYGFVQKHASVGIGTSSSDDSEVKKGAQHVHDAKARLGASVQNPHEDEDRKARSKSGKSFLRKLGSK